MRAWGIPAPGAGHLAPSGGWWHPGPQDNCDRCAPATFDCGRCHKTITQEEWQAHLAWHRGATIAP
jgi:hypothetical protein